MLTAAPPATAFSCNNWPVITDIMNDARNSPDEILVGYGKFSSDISMASLPRNGETSFHQFNGILFDEGLSLSVEQTQIAARFDCEEGIWCGFPQVFLSETDYLIAFARDKETGQLYVAHSGPCDFTVGHEMKVTNLQELAQCLSDGDCTQTDLGF